MWQTYRYYPEPGHGETLITYVGVCMFGRLRNIIYEQGGTDNAPESYDITLVLVFFCTLKKLQQMLA